MELLANSNRRIFLELVRELVRHSASYPRARKLGLVEKPRIEMEFKSRGGIEEVVGELKTKKYEVSLKPLPPPREINRPALQQARITIPEQKLPPHFQYLQPTPTNRDIDLGKLNPLAKDPMVRIIDCPGPDQNLIVVGNMGTKKTGIILGRDEINGIIEKFSKESKIPINEGVFKVVVGRFIFLAIISEIIGSRFTLRKMIAAPNR